MSWLGFGCGIVGGILIGIALCYFQQFQGAAAAKTVKEEMDEARRREKEGAANQK